MRVHGSGTVTSALLLATMTGTAWAGAVEDYVNLRATELIDLQCKALKYVEHTHVVVARDEALRNTQESGWLRNGKFDDAQYQSWFDAREATALQIAASTGCTKAAEPYLLFGRGKANELIYRGLVLAFYFDGLPADSLDRAPLTDDQKLAAQRYDGFLQQIYQANFPAFADAQRQLAFDALPATSFNPFSPTGQDGGWDGLGLDLLGGALRSDEDYNKFWSARSQASTAVDAVELEVVAESNGWRLIPESVDAHTTIPVLTRSDGAAPVRMQLWAGPTTYRLGDDRVLRMVIARQPDGGLRLMTYGTASAALSASSTARLFVQNAPHPEGFTSWSYFETASWRDTPVAFDGTAVEAACLGGPCFDFPAEAVNAITANPGNDLVELFLAAEPDAVPSPPVDKATRPGRLSVYSLARLGG
ncbi:MAG: hypothetical protein IPK28_01880 [Devosia sp.]|nr:hypothetical protein [Devosia sp.]